MYSHPWTRTWSKEASPLNKQFCVSTSLWNAAHLMQGFPGGAGGKEPTHQCRRQRLGFDPWVGRIPWGGKWQPVGGRHEALCPWQRSWGRRLAIRKGRIEPQESPWKSLNIYPHNQSLPTLLLCALTYTSDFTGGCPPPPLLEKELT